MRNLKSTKELDNLSAVRSADRVEAVSFFYIVTGVLVRPEAILCTEQHGKVIRLFCVLDSMDIS